MALYEYICECHSIMQKLISRGAKPNVGAFFLGWANSVGKVHVRTDMIPSLLHVASYLSHMATAVRSTLSSWHGHEKIQF